MKKRVKKEEEQRKTEEQFRKKEVIKILFQNVEGLKKKEDDFREWVRSFDMFHYIFCGNIRERKKKGKKGV